MYVRNSFVYKKAFNWITYCLKCSKSTFKGKVAALKNKSAILAMIKIKL